MNPNNRIFPLYKLSNEKFRHVQITTTKNQILNGQFVAFEVINGITKKSFPIDAYCFLPAIAAQEYWKIYNSLNGMFNEFPKQVVLFKPNEIVKIVIDPVLF